MKTTMGCLAVLLVIAAAPAPACAEGGIIGKMRGVLKRVSESDSDKQVESLAVKEEKEETEGETQQIVEEPDQPGEQQEDAKQQSAKAGHSFQEEIEAHIKAISQELAKLRDGRSPDEPFIEPKGPPTPTASTTDEQGNTTTVSMTKDGVWITEVAGPDGRPISTTKKQELPDGTGRTETVDHQTGRVSQVETAVENMQRQKKTSLEREPDGTTTATVYENGRPSGSRITRPDGTVTRTVFDQEGRPQYGNTTDRQGNELATLGRKDFTDGDSMTWETDNRRNTTTMTSRFADSSLIQTITDTKTGETLSRAGLNPDGSRISPQTGKYVDDAFKQADVFTTRRMTSSRDWKRGTEESADKFGYNQQQEALDRQLLGQMRGGQPVTGSDLIVSSRSIDRMRSFDRGGEDWEETEFQRSDYEIRHVKPEGDYEIKPWGNPVSGVGEGSTPSKALANALNSASHVVSSHVTSEMIDHIRSAEARQGREATSVDEAYVQSDAEASSFVVFKDYVVKRAGRTETGAYEVEIAARPGLATKR